MAGEICPLFERAEGDTINFIGAWMLHPVNLKVVPDNINFLELGHIGPMAAAYIRKEPCRQIPNNETDIGHGCKFLGGAFVMGVSHPAPNEKGGVPDKDFTYVIKKNNGVTICVREGKTSSVSSAPLPQAQPRKKWWQFWK